MSRVRPLESRDIPELARLYEGAARSGGSTPPPGLAAALDRTFLATPWADPEIPSLVYEGAEDRIVAFIGAHVRRIRIDGEPARLVCAGQLASEAAARRRGAGTVLLRDLLSGPQELTITDGATPTVSAMWGPLGGRTAFLRSLVWTRVFRPARAAGDRFRARYGLGRWTALGRPLSAAFDAALRRGVRPAPAEGLDAPDELRPEVVADYIAEAAAGTRLHVDYDPSYLAWLFEEMGTRTGGDLVKHSVRRGGRVVGWYVAYLKPGGVGQVMQVAALGPESDAVLDQLFQVAWDSGTAALQGRLEPHLFEPLSERGCLIRHGDRVLFHARDAEVRGALAAEQTFLTRMDGEWWMAFHLEQFSAPGPLPPHKA